MTDVPLFDPEPYLAPGATPRAHCAPSEPPEVRTLAIVVDAHWRGVSRTQPGVVHAITTRPPPGGRPRDANSSSKVSWCGLVVVPQTYAVGEFVQGCQTCVDRGAPAQRARVMS